MRTSRDWTCWRWRRRTGSRSMRGNSSASWARCTCELGLCSISCLLSHKVTARSGVAKSLQRLPAIFYDASPSSKLLKVKVCKKRDLRVRINAKPSCQNLLRYSIQLRSLHETHVCIGLVVL